MNEKINHIREYESKAYDLIMFVNDQVAPLYPLLTIQSEHDQNIYPLVRLLTKVAVKNKRGSFSNFLNVKMQRAKVESMAFAGVSVSIWGWDRGVIKEMQEAQSIISDKATAIQPDSALIPPIKNFKSDPLSILLHFKFTGS